MPCRKLPFGKGGKMPKLGHYHTSLCVPPYCGSEPCLLPPLPPPATPAPLLYKINLTYLCMISIRSLAFMASWTISVLFMFPSSSNGHCSVMKLSTVDGSRAAKSSRAVRSSFRYSGHVMVSGEAIVSCIFMWEVGVDIRII